MAGHRLYPLGSLQRSLIAGFQVGGELGEGPHLHSNCSFRRIVWQPWPSLISCWSRNCLEHCLSMSSHHHLLQPFASSWRHSRFNSHFRTSSSDITITMLPSIS